MKAHAARAARACLYVLCALPLAGPARAQSSSAPAPAPAYEDRLIGGGNLAPDISLGDYYSNESSGLARSGHVDAVASTLESLGANPAPTLHENGIVAAGQWETGSYGTFSADLGARIGDGVEPILNDAGNERTSFSLHQRAMPFDGGWQADNGLGDLNTPQIALERQQPRFILASGTMVGAETEWRGPSGVQIVAGGGEPGVFEGIKVPTFDTLGGSTATLGAQWAPAPQWTVGGEYAGARDANLYYQAPGSTLLPPEISNQRISSNTGILSAAWQAGGTRAQMNLIDGNLDGNANAFGFWVDGSHTQGAVTQSFGAFRIDPNLAWGNQLITSDVEGGYYRLGYQTRRWVTDIGIDEVRSVSGLGADSTFINGDARYQLWRDTGVGGVVNVLLARDGGHETAWSVEGYVDNANSLGSSRVQLDYATNSSTNDVSTTLQQTWKMPTGSRFATSLGIDHVYTAATPLLPAAYSTLARIAAYGGGDLTARLSLDGTVQFATAVEGRIAPTTSADVSLTWQLARGWQTLLTYYENHVGSWSPLVVTSPLTPAVPVPQASLGQRGIFLTLRWQDARGGHFVPLGGVPGSGSGRLTGVVYLDANENGHFDAGEAGAANVTVVLDGRFSTRTDANGRFDFQAVAAGHHLLTVQPDNLPLPWSLVNQGRTEVDVTTRDRIDVNIAAVRLK
jgi:SdrD B-like domain